MLPRLHRKLPFVHIPFVPCRKHPEQASDNRAAGAKVFRPQTWKGRLALWLGMPLALGLAAGNVNPLQFESPQCQDPHSSGVGLRNPIAAAGNSGHAVNTSGAIGVEQPGAYQWPAFIQEPLAEEYMLLDPSGERGGERADVLRAHWYERVARSPNGVAFVPMLHEIDPAKPTIVWVPGRGNNFQDMSGLLRGGITDHMNVVLMVFDHRGVPYNVNSCGMADVMGPFENALVEQAEAEDLPPPTVLPVFGHSGGGLGVVSMFGRLNERGELLPLDTPVVLVDAALRGKDGSYSFMQYHPIKRPFFFLFTKFTKSDIGGISVLNGVSPVTEAAARTAIPEMVTIITVINDDPDARTDAVSSWYPRASELRMPGEMKRIYEWFQADRDFNSLQDGDWDDFDYRDVIFMPVSGLQWLMRTMQQHSPDHFERIHQAAIEPGMTLEQFTGSYGEIIDDWVRTFFGQHTDFMRTDSRFIPWLLQLIGNLLGGQPAPLVPPQMASPT